MTINSVNTSFVLCTVDKVLRWTIMIYGEIFVKGGEYAKSER